MRRKAESIAVGLLLLLALGCGGGKEASGPAAATKKAPPKLPTAAEARHILESSSDLGQFEFDSTAVTLPVTKSAMTAAQLANAKQLIAAGWMKFDGDTIELTKGKDDGRFNIRGNGFMDVIPVAKKRLGDVTNVRPSPDGCDADFAWEWEQTEVGTAFKSGDVAKMFGKARHSTVTFLWDGANWSVLRIR